MVYMAQLSLGLGGFSRNGIGGQMLSRIKFFSFKHDQFQDSYFPVSSKSNGKNWPLSFHSRRWVMSMCLLRKASYCCQCCFWQPSVISPPCCSQRQFTRQARAPIEPGTRAQTIPAPHSDCSRPPLQQLSVYSTMTTLSQVVLSFRGTVGAQNVNSLLQEYLGCVQVAKPSYALSIIVHFS